MTEQNSTSIKPDINPEQEVALMLTDMVQYASHTATMTPLEIQDFILGYHKKLSAIVNPEDNNYQEIEPIAGDGAIVVFRSLPEEKPENKSIRSLEAAINLSRAISNGSIQNTRIGLFVGDIIITSLKGRVMKFGNSFAAASRLQELCDYFGTSILMDRKVAEIQDDYAPYLVSIGKMTPKNFGHPIHAFSVYLPGIQGIPQQVSKDQLFTFIELKNRAMEHFSGNRTKQIDPDFPMARDKLQQAQQKFLHMTGKRDTATDCILQYINDNPCPAHEFSIVGMLLEGKRGDTTGIRLPFLSMQFLKAMDYDLYRNLLIDTDWEQLFKLEWRDQGETIIKIHQPADGIYYIVSGTADTVNSSGRLIATLEEGDIFGEMAYFSNNKKRNATVTATTDMVLRKISSQDFVNHPGIQRIFKIIAERRQS